MSHRAIAQACAIGVGTVSLYLQRTAQRGLGWPLPAELDAAALEAWLFRRAAPAHDRVRPDCAYIHRELKRDGVTLQLLWEEYAQVHPNGYRRTQFCDIYRQWARRLRPSMRQVHRAGEKTFIDFSGKRARCGASSCSSPCSARAASPTSRPTQQLPDWVDALGALNQDIDYHVLVERHAYTVPFQLLREQVDVRYTTTTVDVFFKGRRVSSHRRRYDGQPSTVPEHMPSAHRAHAEWTPSRLIRWAEKVGPATGELVARILESRPHPEQGYKAVLGLMRVGRQHGNPRLDAASARAIALGSCRFHTVKNILATGQDRLPLEPPAETAPTPTHANIRGANYYAATKRG